MTEEDQTAEATFVEPEKTKKKKIISLPFLIIMPILGVAAFFGAKQLMFMSMLGELKKEADKPTVVRKGTENSSNRTFGALPATNTVPSGGANESE